MPEAILRTQAIVGGSPGAVALAEPGEQVCAELQRVRGRGQVSRCVVSTSLSGDEAGASNRCLGTQGVFYLCCGPWHLKHAFNGWLFVGVGLLSQTIKQMQQRMLELKKTLQKELVSDPSPRRWLCGAPQGPRFLMVRPPPPGPQISGKSDVGWWDSGPVTLNALLERGSDPWHKPFL